MRKIKMTCNHYEGNGLKKHFKVDEKLKCKLCHKQLSMKDITKLKSSVGVK